MNNLRKFVNGYCDHVTFFHPLAWLVWRLESLLVMKVDIFGFVMITEWAGIA
jgi:hypothetical protein